MASQVSISQPATIVWDNERQNELKANLKEGAGTGVNMAAPLVGMAVQAGVNSSITKSTDTTGNCLKARVTSCVAPNNVPMINQVVNGTTAVAKEVAIKVATPLVDTCVASTAAVAKQSINRGIDSCVDTLSTAAQKV